MYFLFLRYKPSKSKIRCSKCTKLQINITTITQSEKKDTVFTFVPYYCSSFSFLVKLCANWKIKFNYNFPKLIYKYRKYYKFYDNGGISFFECVYTHFQYNFLNSFIINDLKNVF